MNRRDISMVTGLLTGHCYLSRHLQLIGIAEDPECHWCLEDKETSSHVLTEWPAIARVRERHFGSSALNPEDVKNIQPRKLCTFAKEREGKKGCVELTLQYAVSEDGTNDVVEVSVTRFRCSLQTMHEHERTGEDRKDLNVDKRSLYCLTK
ncbi:hypothetical protein NQ317_009677 [Molorchus minor]|uniref:Uncharacterized protein n=1 Tax=Molorchus minor TaxID=1323400 RepID=A0ABQ9JII4_9CUCU|nr:hypothetical protein NQ317_009677 [Molorchus minor]